MRTVAMVGSLITCILDPGDGDVHAHLCPLTVCKAPRLERRSRLWRGRQLGCHAGQLQLRHPVATTTMVSRHRTGALTSSLTSHVQARAYPRRGWRYDWLSYSTQQWVTHLARLRAICSRRCRSYSFSGVSSSSSS